jgi:hypothetical protein
MKYSTQISRIRQKYYNTSMDHQYHYSHLSTVTLANCFFSYIPCNKNNINVSFRSSAFT